jgi:sec-independent protein translocase protein TatA
VFEGLLSPTHLIIILVIALVVLGPKRLPDAGKSLGSAMRGFKDSLTASHDEDDDKPALKAKEQEKEPV